MLCHSEDPPGGFAYEGKVGTFDCHPRTSWQQILHTENCIIDVFLSWLRTVVFLNIAENLDKHTRCPATKVLYLTLRIFFLKLWPFFTQHLELAPQIYRTQHIRYRTISPFSSLSWTSRIPAVKDIVDYDNSDLSYDMLCCCIHLGSYRSDSYDFSSS